MSIPDPQPPAADERECRYPCDCGQFADEHCACMEGHAPATPDAGDVEALEEALRRAFWNPSNGGNWSRIAADLASDWLASHDAATADRVRRETLEHERMQQADRLQNALGALDSLKHQTERVGGKREGVALALSYIEEDRRMARNEATR